MTFIKGSLNVSGTPTRPYLKCIRGMIRAVTMVTTGHEREKGREEKLAFVTISIEKIMF